MVEDMSTQHVRLSHQDGSGPPLPNEYGMWRKLKIFSVYENNVMGTIPSELGSWKALKTFAVNNNILSGTLPTELGENFVLELGLGFF